MRLGSKGGFAQIKDHPFIQGTDWEKIRTFTPPFVPHVYTYFLDFLTLIKLDSPTDTSYFHLTQEEKRSSLDSEESPNATQNTDTTDQPDEDYVVPEKIGLKVYSKAYDINFKDT